MVFICYKGVTIEAELIPLSTHKYFCHIIYEKKKKGRHIYVLYIIFDQIYFIKTILI